MEFSKILQHIYFLFIFHKNKKADLLMYSVVKQIVYILLQNCQHFILLILL